MASEKTDAVFFAETVAICQPIQRRILAEVTILIPDHPKKKARWSWKNALAPP